MPQFSRFHIFIARNFARTSIEEQKKAFQTWGLLADIENECYYTYDKNYIKNQLRQFYNLYEKVSRFLKGKVLFV